MKPFKDFLQETIKDDTLVKGLKGCSNHGCKFIIHRGMGTNAGCKCHENLTAYEVSILLQSFSMYIKYLKELQVDAVSNKLIIEDDITIKLGKEVWGIQNTPLKENE